MLLALGALAAPGTATASAPTRPDLRVPARSVAPPCQRYRVPVRLAELDPTVWHVAGWLCGHPRDGDTIQVLFPGGWTGHIYWDWPQHPARYSYVGALAAAGYATFNIDRIGTGQSDHPPAVLVNLPAEAYVAHQFVGDLRAGAIGGVRFRKVILVGSSFGSFLSIFEAAIYGDVDGLIVSGALVTPGSGYARLFASVYPAQLDPRFANANLPLGYTTTLPGSRADLAFYRQTADPDVIALDEQTKETGTAGEAASFYQWEAFTRQVHVPVLSAVGDHDAFFCDIQCGTPGSATMLEPAYWSPDTCLEQFVLPGAGHLIVLHHNAPLFFNTAAEWANRRVGASAGVSATEPCLSGAR